MCLKKNIQTRKMWCNVASHIWGVCPYLIIKQIFNIGVEKIRKKHVGLSCFYLEAKETELFQKHFGCSFLQFLLTMTQLSKKYNAGKESVVWGAYRPKWIQTFFSALFEGLERLPLSNLPLQSLHINYYMHPVSIINCLLYRFSF